MLFEDICTIIGLPTDAPPDDILTAVRQGAAALAEVEAIGAYLATQTIPAGVPRSGAAAICAGLIDHYRGLTMGHRKCLPNRRTGYIQKVRIAGQTMYLRTGEYANGELGEIFLTVNKKGTFTDAALNAFAKALSLGLQYGVPLAEYVDGFLHTRFEPAGWVEGDPDLSEVTSILDYVARRLGIDYLDRGDLRRAKPVCEAVVPQETPSDTDVLDEPGVVETGTEVPQALIQSLQPDPTLMGYTGNVCTTCGSTHMTRNGSCEKCMDCGSTTGCS